MNTLIADYLERYPLIKKYFSEAIYRLINNPKNSVKELLEIQLIRYSVSHDNVLANLERHLGEREFTNINVPINRLRKKFSEYGSVMAELAVAKILKDEGMTDITFIEEDGNPDIQYAQNGVIHYAEVKNLEDLDPEFPIIDNKLEAMSVLDNKYQKDFYIRLNDPSPAFASLQEYEKQLRSATDKFIELLNEHLQKNSIEDLVISVKEFVFTVSFKAKRVGYFLMYGGEVMKYGSSKDIFLKMSSVYSRFINCTAKGIKQLARKRGQSLASIKEDRLYVFLNSGRHANFVPDELEGIIKRLSKTLGIEDLVTLKIQL